MKEVGDVVTWLVGILGTLTLTSWGMRRRSDNAKFKGLYDEQRSHQERLGIVETRIEMLSEIREQNKLMAADITAIKVATSRFTSAGDS